jgi:hypothetical protein
MPLMHFCTSSVDNNENHAESDVISFMASCNEHKRYLSHAANPVLNLLIKILPCVHAGVLLRLAYLVLDCLSLAAK